MTTVSLTCPHCGGNQFIHPTDANLDSTYTCTGCAATFTGHKLAGNISLTPHQAEGLAAEALRSALGKMLK